MPLVKISGSVIFYSYTILHEIMAVYLNVDCIDMKHEFTIFVKANERKTIQFYYFDTWFKPSKNC